jgi:hypothetical protein
MIKLDPQIDWPPGQSAKDALEPDIRMVRCVLAGYLDCPANTPKACICSSMSAQLYLDRSRAKYGPDEL